MAADRAHNRALDLGDGDGGHDRAERRDCGGVGQARSSEACQAADVARHQRHRASREEADRQLVNEQLTCQGRVEDEVDGGPRVAAHAELGVHRGEVLPHLGHRGRHHARRQSDKLRDGHALGDVSILLVWRQGATEHAVRDEERVPDRAVNPELGLGVLGAVGPTGHRVGAVDLLVNGLHNCGCVPRRCGVAVHRRDHVHAGSLQSIQWTPAEVAVLRHPSHRKGVESLQHQGQQAADEASGTAEDPPGHRIGSEQTVVLIGFRSRRADYRHTDNYDAPSRLGIRSHPRRSEGGRRQGETRACRAQGVACNRQ